MLGNCRSRYSAAAVGSVPSSGGSAHTIRELSTVYVIAARISRAVLESDGEAGCCSGRRLPARGRAAPRQSVPASARPQASRARR
jgi:hypothetical protein